VAVDSGALRIGEFARRVGISPELLRAWERRYGLLHPIRSPGGFRLYTTADAERVARMRQGLESGLSAAEAARIAVEDSRPAVGLLEDVTSRLLLAIRGYDEAGAQAVLDESLAAFGLERVLQEVILPALAQVGDDWEQGTLDVAQEHFASNVIRGRLLALARLWGRGGGPLALLACAPGERHDISLLAFGLVLRSHGWRILFLGADTPVSTLTGAVAATEPALVVVTSFDAGLLEREVRPLRRLATAARLILSGPGASEEMCRRIGVERLDGDVVEAANAIAAGA
jgi:DNA-binding transcriptional MerR regulator